MMSAPCADMRLSGWYRFGGDAGNQMADTCVNIGHCGTWYPGWISGGHPTMADGAVVRKTCFTTNHGCCSASIYISVRNCGGFHVYNLTSLTACNLRYCGNGLEPPTTVAPGRDTLFSFSCILYTTN